MDSTQTIQQKKQLKGFAKEEPLVSADLPFVSTPDKMTSILGNGDRILPSTNPVGIPTSVCSGNSSPALSGFSEYALKFNSFHMMAATNTSQVQDLNACFSWSPFPLSNDLTTTKDNTYSNDKSARSQQKDIFNSFIQNPICQPGEAIHSIAKKEDSTSFDPFKDSIPQISLQHELINVCRNYKENKQGSIKIHYLSNGIAMAPMTPNKDIKVEKIHEDSPELPNEASKCCDEVLLEEDEPRDKQEKNLHNKKRQNQRRKKLRPKVVRDGSPSKNTTIREQGSVRKKKNSGDNIAQKKENIDSQNTPIERINETDDNSCKVEFSNQQQIASVRKLVKRRLNFENEGALSDKCLDQTSPRCKSTVLINQMLDEYINLTSYSSPACQPSRREILKKNWKKLTREAENGENENDLNVYGIHSNEIREKRRTHTWQDWRNGPTEQNSHVFYSVDELTTSKNAKNSDFVFEFDPAKRAKRKRSKVLIQTRKPASVVTITVGSQPYSCMEALLAKSFKIKKRKRSVRGRRTVRQTETDLQERNSQIQNALLRYGNFQEPLYTNLISQAMIPYINRRGDQFHQGQVDVATELPNALVLYDRRMMVPFTSHVDEIKQQLQRPKVDIDEETNRVWKLLMEKADCDAEVGSDINREKWWQEERKMFHGRVDSFIARMHRIQGNRRFSEWKGSVLDSVVGVFLTQNVSDYLSSSAFMELASKYPIKLNGKIEEPNAECRDSMENPGPKKQSMDRNQEYKNQQHENLIKLASNQVIEMEKAQKGSTGMAQVQQYGLNLASASIYDSEDSEVTKEDIPIIGDEFFSPQIDDPNMSTARTKRRKVDNENTEFDWDKLRKETWKNGDKPKRCNKRMDTVDWEAVRCADVKVIAETIQKRGMNNVLADRIKNFLNRLVRDHGSLDLEWLRDVPPHEGKEYLLSIKGLGLKSVECVRLLTLHQHAFPVDTNVGRICVRLGWVPIQPLPDTVQFYLLELYPPLEHIQKYIWPRLCKLNQHTLYELHYQMITFGKVFCTKRNPNCNACPMKGECKHFASAFASARFALPAAEEKSLGNPTIHTTSEFDHMLLLPQFEGSNIPIQVVNSSEAIVELPSTPEIESMQVLESDTKYFVDEDPDNKPNVEKFNRNLQNHTVDYTDLQDCDKKALVAITPEAASIPLPKLKLAHRLRTEHQAYELPDSHPLLEGFDQREPDDSSPYLLVICAPGEIMESAETPEACCTFQASELCEVKTCSTCGLTQEETTKGTLLIPCRTATRGAFPLNGTYFQVNEVFADDHSSHNPINVPRKWIWNLPRRMVYMGAYTSGMFTGLSVEAISECFQGYICLRGFDRKTRAPRPLAKRLHLQVEQAKILGKEDKVKEDKVKKEKMKKGKM